MKGVIFNLLQAIVERDLGEEAWDDLLGKTGLSGAYTSLGSYPDAELTALVRAAAGEGRSDAEVLRWFGREALPLLAGRYPVFFAPYATTIPFLLTLNDIIHPEVRKLYPEADTPVFTFERQGANGLLLGYRSQRRMCAFAEGLVEGAAGFFGERVSIAQPVCMLRGQDRCELACTFTTP